MNIIKLLLLLLVCLSFFVNCANDEDLSHSLLQAENNADPLIMAKMNAAAFVNDIYASTRSTEKEIASIYPWRSCEIFPTTRASESDFDFPDTLLYIVNFTNNDGYVLVNANSLYKEVVAYVEDGNLTPDSVIDNPGFRHFLKGVAVNQKSFMDSVYYPFPIDTNQVVMLDCPTDSYVKIYEWRTVKTKKALLMTQWGQTKPYSLSFSVNGKVPDIVVATSQIVASHRYPSSFGNTSFSWDIILEHGKPISSEGVKGVAELMKTIGKIEMSRSNGNFYQSTYFFDDVEDCFNQFGYDCTFSNYDLDSCLTDLDYGLPILVNGKDVPTSMRYSWVVDGYIKRRLYSLVTGQYYPDVKYYMHCNWGREGKDNGYFLNEVFCPSNKVFISSSDNVSDTEGDMHNYNSMLRMFYHVHPRN